MIFSWLYVFFNAISALLRQLCGLVVSPAFILLMGSIFSIIYFHCINLKHLTFIYKTAYHYYRHWFALNISITAMWLAAFYAPSLIGASLSSFLFFGLLSLLGLIFMQHQHKKINQLKHLSSLLLLILFLSTIVTNLIAHFNQTELFGIILASIAGIAGFIYSKQSAQFVKLTSFTTSQILATRFYLTIPICLILLPHPVFLGISRHNFIFAFITALFCLIIPIYFSQKGIEKAGPERNAVICGTMPLVTALLQNYYVNPISWHNLSFYLLYSIIISLPFMAKKYFIKNAALTGIE